MSIGASVLERTGPDDRFADYCLWDYAPVSTPSGKLRSANLLWRAIASAGGGPHLIAACDALRQTLGPFRTVYGVKKMGGQLRFEFYFYDYARLERQVSISRVLNILRPSVACSLPPPEGRPYFMFSIDLDEDVASGRAPLEVVNIYIGNPGSTVSSGICYEQSAAGLRLANFYFFFHARREMNDIVAKVSCSAHHDLRRLPLASILRPELLNCEVVVVANKKFNDGVYFSRLPIDSLIDFLGREQFPADLVAFVRKHRGELDHMLYDIGLDYVVEDGTVRITKSAFYGIL
jgi:hypothetical protein